MINALGLGTFYSSFMVRAAEGNDKIRKFLKLNTQEQVVTCIVVGYPKVEYKRTVPRKYPSISYL